MFPEEGRFRERAYAEQVAVEFCDALIAQGTTSASIFSSSHPEATDALFAETVPAGPAGDGGADADGPGRPPGGAARGPGGAGGLRDAHRALARPRRGTVALLRDAAVRAELHLGADAARGGWRSGTGCGCRRTCRRTARSCAPRRRPSPGRRTTWACTRTTGWWAAAACSRTASTCRKGSGSGWRVATRWWRTARTATSSWAAGACRYARPPSGASGWAWGRTWARGGPSPCGGWRRAR